MKTSGLFYIVCRYTLLHHKHDYMYSCITCIMSTPISLPIKNWHLVHVRLSFMSFSGEPAGSLSASGGDQCRE